MMFAEERESVEGENQFTSYQDLLRRRGGWTKENYKEGETGFNTKFKFQIGTDQRKY